MNLEPLISRIFQLRALLVLATLISLCVSNNVGPSFLPLPVVTDRIAEKPQENQGDTASRRQFTESDTFREPMMGHAQKRTAKEPQPQPQPQPRGVTPRADLLLPNDARVAAEVSFAVSLFATASLSQPPGRAPPRLV